MIPPDSQAGSIRRFATLCGELDELDLEIGSSGNASMRVGEKIAITPTGATFAASAEPGHISLVALKGDAAIAGPQASSDVRAHRQIYAARPDVACIIHTHAHFVTFASILGREIPPICTMHADYFGSEIRLVPYANHRSGGFGPQHEFREGSAFLLQNHGGLLLFSAEAIAKAAYTVRAFEEVCHLYCDLVCAQPRVQWTTVPDDDAMTLHAYYTRNYGNR